MIHGDPPAGVPCPADRRIIFLYRNCRRTINTFQIFVPQRLRTLRGIQHQTTQNPVFHCGNIPCAGELVFLFAAAPHIGISLRGKKMMHPDGIPEAQIFRCCVCNRTRKIACVAPVFIDADTGAALCPLPASRPPFLIPFRVDGHLVIFRVRAINHSQFRMRFHFRRNRGIQIPERFRFQMRILFQHRLHNRVQIKEILRGTECVVIRSQHGSVLKRDRFPASGTIAETPGISEAEMHLANPRRHILFQLRQQLPDQCFAPGRTRIAELRAVMLIFFALSLLPCVIFRMRLKILFIRQKTPEFIRQNSCKKEILIGQNMILIVKHAAGIGIVAPPPEARLRVIMNVDQPELAIVP